MRTKPLLRSFALSSALIATPAMATDIVASIKPVELLVRAVAGDDATVTTLVPGGSSPHNYTMKPSQRRALEGADVIFWVGPDMETFLARLLGNQEFAGRTVAFMPGDGAPEDDHEDDHGHGHKDDHSNEHNHGHDHGDGEDPHVWLDPALALDMARDIRDTLANLDGADTEQLDQNLARFEQNLTQAEARIRSQLSAASGVSLFTYHDAFSRFAEHYSLKLDGVLTLNPELSPGARHIAQVQDKLRAANQPCLLTEPQFNRQWWRSITEGLNVTFTTWDPLATDIPAGPDGYVEFQQSIADAVLTCLPENA